MHILLCIFSLNTYFRVSPRHSEQTYKGMVVDICPYEMGEP